MADISLQKKMLLTLHVSFTPISVSPTFPRRPSLVSAVCSTLTRSVISENFSQLTAGTCMHRGSIQFKPVIIIDLYQLITSRYIIFSYEILHFS